ncbi:MAG: hypothetical protein JSW11_15515 [Candidatus Heimdallarchaeota archaeon]|nr:MAG: hypothetical protein JSW11_15515 [Candidatus Heimdallarchaeota archaeon]
MSQPNQTLIIENYRVRNYTKENVEQDELSCLINFISSLDICKACVAEIPKLQSSFGSNLDYQIDFETRTLDIHYSKNIVSGW